MANLRIPLSLGLVTLLASWAAVAAPYPPDGPQWHHGMHHAYLQPSPNRNYDPATEITVSGVVDRIWIEDCLGCGCAGGTHFTLEAGGETYEAHLGPTCYLAGKGWEVLRSDRVEITGALLPYRAGGKGILVRKMKRGDETLLLRDENGVPLWNRPPCEMEP
jgi:hypothetical protein